jgi:hypothetical protein
MKWFSRNNKVAMASVSPQSLVSGSATVRHYPPTGHVVSPIETAALAGQRLSGACTICGAVGRFKPFNDNLRESGACSQCRSSNRQRQMAWMLRRELGLGVSGPLVIPESVGIYNTEANGPLHQALHAHPKYECSEYWGDKAEFGEIVDGTRNEDLQALSFASASFDVVLSSDVLEHMPQPYQAHSEIYRVLKPGGRHIFTVPYGEALIRDNVRASLVDGKVIHHHEAMYHGDPVRPGEGILVWTIFGLEMLVRLNEIGFETEFWRLQEPSVGIIGPGADVFIARKPWS